MDLLGFLFSCTLSHTQQCVCFCFYILVGYVFWWRMVGFFFVVVVVLVLNFRLFTCAIENIDDHYHHRHQHCHRHRHYHHHHCQCSRHSHRHYCQYYWCVSVFLLFKRNVFLFFFFGVCSSFFVLCVCVKAFHGVNMLMKLQLKKESVSRQHLLIMVKL